MAALMYNALRDIVFPEGVIPPYLAANEICLISEDALALPGVRQAIRAGWLEPVAAHPDDDPKARFQVFQTPPMQPAEPELPTAQEILDALAEHPELFKQVKDYCLSVHEADKTARRDLAFAGMLSISPCIKD